MSITLSPEQQRLVEEALASGPYGNPLEVIDRALEVLRKQNEWLRADRDEIRSAILEGAAELDRGEGIPDIELDAYRERLKAQPE
jgi:Arc/MetJ-type ribon-helix-helix transcriptional regulator